MNIALKKKIKKVIGNLLFSKRQNDVTIVKRFGIDMYVFSNQEVGRKIALGLYERNEIGYLDSNVKSTDTCLDIGANVGYFTFLFATKSLDVIAFEPIKKNAKLIELTAAVNNIGNLTVRNCLVSDNAGQVDFTEAAETALSGISSEADASYLKDSYAESSIRRYIIESVTIDSIGLNKLDIVKIDVEGAELKVLRGMKSTFSELKPRLVMVEAVDSAMRLHGDSIHELIGFMGEIGYLPFILQDGELVSYTGQHVPNDNIFFCPR